jgi:pimeloyl-ACP methyl ester carboxylesterase
MSIDHRILPGGIRAAALSIAILCLGGLPVAQALEYRMIDGTGGLPLQIVESGPKNAPGLLLIHGASMSSGSWRQQLESELAERWHLVAFDLRGHGNSGKSWKKEDYADSRTWADDVATVIAATGLERPVIVAWSYGGHVTMDFLRHYSPERLRGVVFVGTTGGMLPFPPPDPERAADFARFGRLALSPDPGDRLQAARGVVTGMAAAPVDWAVIDREVAAMLSVTPSVRKAMAGRALDNSDLLNRLSMPVLFTVGDQDGTASIEGVSSLVDQLPNARMSIYQDTGHLLFIERRERFNEELADFVADLLEGDDDG